MDRLSVASRGVHRDGALASLMSFVTIGAALRPLRDLAEGLARLRTGDLTRTVDCSGPPEIREAACPSPPGCHPQPPQFGKTGACYADVSSKTRSAGISRESCTTKLGPLLFAIRANVTAMIDDVGEGGVPAGLSEQRVLQAVEALQVTNRPHSRPPASAAN